MPRIRAESIAAHKEATRNALFEAAEACFRAYGYRDTSLADITSYAGIGRTTVYEYFTDKEDLLVQLVESSVPGIVTELVEGLPQGVTARERLGELIIRGLEMVSSEDSIGGTLMRQLPTLSPDAQRRIRATHIALEDEINRLCREGIETGEFRAFEPEEASRLVFTTLMAASQTLMHGDGKQKLHQVAETLVAFVFGGLSLNG